jgi:alpha-N-arabinofuranosidase
VKVHNRVLHAVDARLFGQFMERPSWGSEIGPEGSLIPGTRELRPEAQRLIRQMQIPVVRFPGGTDVDYIDWLDMIDRVPGRPAGRPVTTGHTGNQVSNNFGYDEFLRLCEELAMQPIVVVSFREGLLSKDGPEQGAKHAASLVAYCNAEVGGKVPEALGVWPRLRAENGHPKPYGVKYWQIGNETWAFTGTVSEDQYLAALRAYIEALRAVDPTVRVIVDGQPAELAARVHRELGDRVAYFAVHHYQPWQIREVRRGDEPVAVAHLTARDIWYAWVTAPDIDPAGQSVLRRGELEQARRLGYPVAMTDWNWNGWWAAPLRDQAALNSLWAKGLGAAGILHAILRQGDVVQMAAQSMLIGDGWDIHAIHCDRHGQSPAFMVPSGQVTMLYSQHHGNRRLEIELGNVPCYEQPYRMSGNRPVASVAYLDVLATRSDNALYLHVINRHFEQALNIAVDVSALERRPETAGTLHILEGRLQNAPATGEDPAPARVRDEPFPIAGPRFAVQLPARSVTVAEVPLRPGVAGSGP